MAHRSGIPLVGLVAVLVVGLWPWIWLADVHPQSRDAVIWLQHADPARSDWLDWTLWGPQFKVALRPVTALSYTATTLLGSPRGHRLLDLALHALAIGLAFAVVRRRPQAAWGPLVAAIVVAIHPLVRYVVPDLARRSYTLYGVLTLLALLAAPGPDEPARRRAARGVLAALLCAAAALTHELGYVAFAACAAMALPADRPLREGIVAQRWLLGASAGLVVALLGWRIASFGGLGGYPRGDVLVHPGATLFTVRALFPVGGVHVDGVVLTGASVVLAVALLASAAVADWRRRPVLRAALAWLIGGWLLFVVQPVWFLRQAHALVPPLALLVGAMVDARGAARATGLTLLAVLGLQIPGELRRAHGERVRAERTSEMMDDLLAVARAMPDGGHLMVAGVRYRSPRALEDPPAAPPGGVPIGARAPFDWVQHLTPGRTITPAVLVFVDVDEPGPVWRGRLAGRQLRITTDRERRMLPLGDLAQVPDRRHALLDLSERAGAWTYLHDGASGHRWVVDPPADE